jgi:hypothetical protein
MRVLIAAIAALILSVIPFLAPGALPGAYRDVGLILLSLYLAVEGLLKLKSGDGAPPRPAQQPQPVATPAAVPAPTPKEEPSQPGEGLVFLSLLQEKGRLLDFLMEDITAYKDDQVAAASRVVHQGCSGIIKQYFDVSPVHAGNEGDKITIDKSSDPERYRLVGKVVGEPPFSGVVIHRGWKTSRVALPRLTRPAEASSRDVIVPAEVEVS